MKLNFVTQPIYILAVLFVKLSIGASLLRIAAVRAWKTTIYSVMGMNIDRVERFELTIGRLHDLLYRGEHHCEFSIIDRECSSLTIITDPSPSV